MVKEDLEELSSVLMEIIETQKMLQRELKYLKDDLKAQNRMIAETMKINRIHQETSVKQAEILDRISQRIESLEMISQAQKVGPIEPSWRSTADEGAEEKPEAILKRQPERELRTEPELRPEPEHEPEVEPEVQKEPEPEFVPEPESAPKVQTEPEPEPESESKVEPPSKPKAKPESQDICGNCGKKLEPVYITCPYCGAVR